MVKLSNLKQKIKGKLQQAKGEFEVQTGHPLKGNINKIKGKINEATADTKIKVDDQGVS